jgi:hypothetical protein
MQLHAYWFHFNLGARGSERKVKFSTSLRLLKRQSEVAQDMKESAKELKPGQWNCLVVDEPFPLYEKTREVVFTASNFISWNHAFMCEKMHNVLKTFFGIVFRIKETGSYSLWSYTPIGQRFLEILETEWWSQACLDQHKLLSEELDVSHPAENTLFYHEMNLQWWNGELFIASVKEVEQSLRECTQNFALLQIWELISSYLN